jgi:hypothetical protein
VGQTRSDSAAVEPVKLFPAVKPSISMPVPNMKPAAILPAVLGYRLFDLQVMQPAVSRIDFGKPKLNLSFAPSKSILDLLRDEPLTALLYGGAIVAGMLNNQIIGEDKLMRIKMDNMIYSRSGIPESARSANGRVTVKSE